VQQPLPPPGWYQDPSGPGLRWWDGTRWTEHHQAAVPLLPAPPVPPFPGTPPLGPVPAVPQQKWWHIPLLVALGVLSTLGYVLLQLLS
jgi:hypothetical protein